MPMRPWLSCHALLIIVLVRPNFYSAGPQASHQLNPALTVNSQLTSLQTTEAPAKQAAWYSMTDSHLQHILSVH